jgi:catechol 2,3-dioxygenase-like lactoylglutathione lyase family enzyme
MKLNHLHIKAADVQETCRFYQHYFGMRKVGEHDGLEFLVDESGFLLAVHHYRDSAQDLPSWFHFGFCLDSPEKVEQLYERMKTDGIKFSKELNGEAGDWLNFYCLDPAGSKVEVSWAKEDVEMMRPVAAATERR